MDRGARAEGQETCGTGVQLGLELCAGGAHCPLGRAGDRFPSYSPSLCRTRREPIRMGLEGVFRNSQGWGKEEDAGPDRPQPPGSPPPAPHLKEQEGRLKADPVLQPEKRDLSRFPSLTPTVRDIGHFVTHFSSKANSLPIHTPSLISLLRYSFTFPHPLAFIWLSFTFFYQTPPGL